MVQILCMMRLLNTKHEGRKHAAQSAQRHADWGSSAVIVIIIIIVIVIVPSLTICLWASGGLCLEAEPSAAQHLRGQLSQVSGRLL